MNTLNAYMLVHNNLFTHMWFKHFIHKLLKKMKKNLQTNMLWTYGLGCVNWQIPPNTIYDVVIICTCTLLLKMLLMHFEIFCKYETLWDKLVAMVVYTFGGLILKSLVVEMDKHVYQKQMNNFNVKVQNCCEKTLKKS